MKKLLTVLTLMAFTATLAATAAESRLENYVNKKLSPITQKEKDFNSKVEAQQKANEAKRAEAKKKQEAQKAALEKAKQDAKARQDARKKAIENEKNYWKNLGK